MVSFLHEPYGFIHVEKYHLAWFTTFSEVKITNKYKSKSVLRSYYWDLTRWQLFHQDKDLLNIAEHFISKARPT